MLFVRNVYLSGWVVHQVKVVMSKLLIGVYDHQVTTVGSDGDATSADEDAETNRKRRELLARRPSYR